MCIRDSRRSDHHYHHFHSGSCQSACSGEKSSGGINLYISKNDEQVFSQPRLRLRENLFFDRMIYKEEAADDLAEDYCCHLEDFTGCNSLLFFVIKRRRSFIQRCMKGNHAYPKKTCSLAERNRISCLIHYIKVFRHANFYFRIII